MSNDDASDLGVALPAAAAALNAEERAGLVNELKSEHDELEKKFFEERAALEAKYQKLYEPLYTKRYEIVNGIVKVEGETNEAVMDEEGDKCVEEKGVPDFWQTAMKMNEILAEESEMKGLSSILKISSGAETMILRNTVLTKTYHMVDDENEPILEKAIGTKIEWYPGKCLTQKVLKKKPKKGSKNAKPIIKTENCESFFNFFNPPQIPEDDYIDDELAEELQDRMEHDYNIGSAIRDKLIPHAVSWFTGEAVQGNEYDGLESDYDSDDQDGDEDEDRDEEDEREERKGKKKSASANASLNQHGERPPETRLDQLGYQPGEKGWTENDPLTDGDLGVQVRKQEGSFNMFGTIGTKMKAMVDGMENYYNY
ncbi:nucleosome assembly protein 1-4-like isoform X2 [Gossypium australe]|uniref:Nucleosome assembly protein 1-4-like isoform X2 n=1 Tax=Gossypium australe TaxID=47621 RepID=A0A5B6UIT8_9ROSI|nr:nucleosome assembly protein 1-4-like isoform X2 [Gossypium australe]